MSENAYSIVKEKQSEAKRIMSYKQYTKCRNIIRLAAAVPLPLAVTVASIKMVKELGKVFSVNISDNEAKRQIVGVISKIDVTYGAGLAVLNGASMMTAAVTEAIGWTLAVNFAYTKRN